MKSRNSKQSKNYCHAVVVQLFIFLLIQISSSYLSSPITQRRRHRWDATTTTYNKNELRLHSSLSPSQPTKDEKQSNSNNLNQEERRIIRGKVNEIDFCMAPSDVSLSRTNSDNNAYLNNNSSSNLSLTRALNDATNRVVRRILLSKSWPSAEALNRSLRMVLSSKNGNSDADATATAAVTTAIEEDDNTAKCPVPRPILNIIMRRGKDQNIPRPILNMITRPRRNKDQINDDNDNDTTIPKNKGVIKGDLLLSSSDSSTSSPNSSSRTNEQWVSDQLQAFQTTYGSIAGYNYAEAYLESILSLATNGVESKRVKDVLQDGVYDESYKRLISVLQSAGVELLLNDDDSDNGGNSDGLKRIGETLSQQDICLSVMDKIQMKKGRNKDGVTTTTVDAVEKSETNEIENEKEEEPTVIPSSATTETKQFRFPFFFKKAKEEIISQEEQKPEEAQEEEEEELKPEDLGGVLLSSSEPSMTRQLNALANIVQRTLLFGGDDEILVLAETLEADIPAFQKRWKNNTSQQVGYEYLSNLILLLRNCYTKGIVSNLDPPLPISSTSYSNSYERLMANLVEGGSGYIKPKPNLSNEYFYNTMIPKNAQDEFGRFALWEVSLRRNQEKNKPKGIKLTPAYPEDLVGNWTVKDEIGGKIIGISTIGFLPDGEIQIYNNNNPNSSSSSSTTATTTTNTGLRWRLDAGPTHLDTVTFQVVSSNDGAILQYKGFIDRGARLESRYSKRSITIRGAVTFLMRDATSSGGSKLLTDNELLSPLDFRMETTRFNMIKIVS